MSKNSGNTSGKGSKMGPQGAGKGRGPSSQVGPSGGRQNTDSRQSGEGRNTETNRKH